MDPRERRHGRTRSTRRRTHAPFEDVLAADRDDPQNLSAAINEILNFERMAELAFSWPEERRLTVAMLGELQAALVTGTSGQLSDAGGLRDRIVVIGSRGRPLDEARFVPPPPGDQLRAGVESLLEWMFNPPDLPTVVRAAMAHYQFETLHPFSDGNGRIGRLLVIVQLLRGAVIREPLLVVSPWFEVRREQYQDALLGLSIDGDWDAWIAFFAEGVAAAAAESQAKVEKLVALQTQLRSRVQDAGKRGKVEQLAADLVGVPYLTVSDVADRYGLSVQGATNIVRVLLDLGVLATETGARSVRGAQLYSAPDVLRVVLNR